MQNFYTISFEVEYRQRMLEQEVRSQARAAQVCPEHGRIRWSHLPPLILMRLRSLPVPRLRLPGFWSAATRRGLSKTLFKDVSMASAAGSCAAGEPL